MRIKAVYQFETKRGKKNKTKTSNSCRRKFSYSVSSHVITGKGPRINMMFCLGMMFISLFVRRGLFTNIWTLLLSRLLRRECVARPRLKTVMFWVGLLTGTITHYVRHTFMHFTVRKIHCKFRPTFNANGILNKLK